MAIATRKMGLALSLTIYLAIAARGADRDAINKAIDGGGAYLKQAQQGTGEWQHNQNRVGATALALLTLLECDVDQDDPVIRRAAAFLRPTTVSLRDTYAISRV